MERIENPNTNCLENMRCPQCGSFGPFRIRACVSVTVTDDGADEDGSDYEWFPDAPCVCRECDHTGTVETFTDPPNTLEVSHVK